MPKFVIFRNIFYNNYAITFIYSLLDYKISIISHNITASGGVFYMKNANLFKNISFKPSEELKKIQKDFFADFAALLITPFDLESNITYNHSLYATILKIVANKLLPNYSISLKENAVHINERNDTTLFNTFINIEPQINNILNQKNFYNLLLSIDWASEIKKAHLNMTLSGYSIKSILTADFYICLLPIIEDKINVIVKDKNVKSRSRNQFLYKKAFYGMCLQLLQNHMNNEDVWCNSKKTLDTQLLNLRITATSGANAQYKCKYTILNKSVLDKAFVNLVHYKYINNLVYAPKFETIPELFPVSSTKVLTATPKFLLNELDSELSNEKREHVSNIIKSEIQYYKSLIFRNVLPPKNESKNILEENLDKISQFYETIPDIYLSDFYALGCALKNNSIFSAFFWYKYFNVLSCFKEEFSHSQIYEYEVNPNLLFFYYFINLPKHLDYQDLKKLTIFIEKYSNLLSKYVTKIEEYYSTTDSKTLSKDLHYIQQEICQNKLIKLFSIYINTNELSEQLDFTINSLPVLEKIKNNGFNDISSTEIAQLISYFPSDPINDLS